MNNDFKFILPAEIEKSKDGEWRVRGLASTEGVDQQGETIIQKGIDLTPIDKRKGVLNWDHQKGPENTIGLLDGYQKTDHGLFIEGRLFKNHSKAKAVREIMESLGEGDRGRIGLSVEGRILDRDPTNPRVIRKCQINAVALTMNPVNADTFADLVKSMNSAEVEFNSQEENKIDEASDEPTFTASQVLSIVQKALGIGAGAAGAPDAKTGGDALSPSDMEAEPLKKKCSSCDKEKCVCEKKTLKRMNKSLYKASLVTILDKLQVLYPDCSRSELWEAVKDRLQTRYETSFGKGFRLKNTSAKEREHKLYEDARQRDDYEENKDKSRTQLAELARESSGSAKDKAKIRAQADAARQVGDRDHVRPGVKG